MGSIIREELNGAAPQEENPANWVPVLNQAIYTPRKLRLICIGAGFGGLSLAYEIQHKSDWGSFIDLQIYDKNPDIGGTWYENRYPGAACDVPSHVYCFPFEPNPNWSNYYAGREEIFEYIKKTAAKWNLDKNVTLNSKITDSTWDEENAKWRVKIVHDGRVIEDECDILVSASGLFNKWTWPEIDGLHSFKGKLLHTADCDTSYDWAGKRVAVIGNGSSAIQVVPKVQKTAKELVSYARNPTWVVPNLLQDAGTQYGLGDYPEETKKMFRENPEVYLKFRRNIESTFNKGFMAMYIGTEMQKGMEAGARMIMEGRLGNDPELIKKFVPKFNVGCRRLSPGDGYLEALQEKNVRSIFDPIVKITENGIVTPDGEELFDLIVAATGFDYSYRPKWNQTGRNGVKLREVWKENATSYFGMCAVDQPNYFIYTGPNAPVSHGNSLLYAMQAMTAYILGWARKIATQDIKSVSVKASVVDDLDVWSQASLKQTVWAGECRSWYKGGKVTGKITGLHAGSGLHYRDIPLNKFCASTLPDYEAEFVFITSRTCKDITPEQAPDYILGYTIGNDLSCRLHQFPDQAGGQFFFAKAFDKFAPLGPVLVSPKVFKSLENPTLISRVNGDVRQNTPIRGGEMIFSPEQILSRMSQGTTIPAGTPVMTGTPAGVGVCMDPRTYLNDGDVVEVELTGLGVLKNKIVFV